MLNECTTSVYIFSTGHPNQQLSIPPSKVHLFPSDRNWMTSGTLSLFVMEKTMSTDDDDDDESEVAVKSERRLGR